VRGDVECFRQSDQELARLPSFRVLNWEILSRKRAAV
jgi:hypothetical protein